MPKRIRLPRWDQLRDEMKRSGFIAHILTPDHVVFYRKRPSNPRRIQTVHAFRQDTGGWTCSNGSDILNHE